MSFLLNFAPCFGAAGQNLPPNTPTEEETTSLVEGSGSLKKGHRSGKLGGAHKTAVLPPQWRPSLCTISEDDIVKEVKVMRRKSASKPNYLGYKNEQRQQDTSFQDLPYVSSPLMF